MSNDSRTAGPWRCFHCDQVFTTVDAATDHFGPAIWSDPACAIDAHRLRELEAELARYREEDTDLHRQMHRMESDHRLALQREEEKGYRRGLADGHRFPADAALAAGEDRSVPCTCATLGAQMRCAKNCYRMDLSPKGGQS